MTTAVPPLHRWRDAPISAVAHLVMPFYRRFPYGGPMPLTKVDPRGVAIPTDRIFYNRIPKAANSTVVGVLAAHSDYARSFHAGAKAKSRFLRPSRLGPQTVAALEADWLKFTLVRHPMTRALSAYLDKIAGRKAQSVPFFRWFGKGEPSFTDFCRYLDAGGLWHDMHWAPQTGILLLPLERFDMIGRFERIEADLEAIIQRGFGAGTELRMRRAGPKPTGADESKDRHLTDQAREILARLYVEDFRAFGYDPGA